MLHISCGKSIIQSIFLYSQIRADKNTPDNNWKPISCIFLDILVLIFFSQCNLSLSLHLVLLVPIIDYFIVYLALAFCSCIRVAVCLPMFFHFKTNIYTYICMYIY